MKGFLGLFLKQRKQEYTYTADRKKCDGLEVKIASFFF